MPNPIPTKPTTNVNAGIKLRDDNYDGRLTTTRMAGLVGCTV